MEPDNGNGSKIIRQEDDSGAGLPTRRVGGRGLGSSSSTTVSLP